MSNTNTLLVIDCSQLCYRAFYTMGELSYNEKKTGVLFGFLAQIFKLANDFDTKRFAFCWDSSKSYRKDFYSGYKQSRHSKEFTKEEELDRKQLFRQRSELRTYILPQLGFKNNLIKTGLEADDLIAYVIDKNGGVVVSSDNDMWQLLDRCTIYNPVSHDRMVEDDLVEKYGVTAKEWIKVKEMIGCNTDEVPGIKGIGIKKAVLYLKNKLPDGQMKYKIESNDGKEIIKRNRRLVKLPFEPDKKGMGELSDNEQFIFDNWNHIFNKYRFNYFLKKENLNKYKEVFELEM